jgi:hypothetical protein
MVELKLTAMQMPSVFLGKCPSRDTPPSLWSRQNPRLLLARNTTERGSTSPRVPAPHRLISTPRKGCLDSLFLQDREPPTRPHRVEETFVPPGQPPFGGRQRTVPPPNGYLNVVKGVLGGEGSNDLDAPARTPVGPGPIVISYWPRI